MRPATVLPLLLSLSVLPALAAPQGDAGWSQFRGPGGRAVADASAPAVGLDLERDLRWRTKVPTGSSSPCFTADRLFVTGADGARLVVLALERETGAVVWQRSFDGEAPQEYMHSDTLVANPSPCTDGERVFVYFGTYGVVALDLDGQVLWERRMPQPKSDFGVGASPILAGGNLIVPRDGAPEAATLALDPATGEERYRIERLGFIASHATPFLWRNSQREELVLTGTKQLCAYDPGTGEPLWNVQDVTIFTCTTPTADAEHLYYAGWSTPNSSARGLVDSMFLPPFQLEERDYEDLGPLFVRLDANKDGVLSIEEVPPGRARDAFAFIDNSKDGVWQREEFSSMNHASGAPGQNVALAVRAGGSGDVTETHVAWRWTRGLPYVASPLLHEGRLWLIKAGGIVTTLDAATGKRKIDRERLPVAGEYYMSPVAIGDHVLVGAVSGELFVLDAKDELRVATMLDFDDPLFATPAALGGRLYVRTEGSVWVF